MADFVIDNSVVLAMRKGLPIATQDRALKKVAIECSVEIFLPMSPQGENL